VPCSTSLPASITKIWSLSLIVEILWATHRLVLPFMRWFSASCTIFSFSWSSALVASSRRRTFGFLMTALAIAILCFYPPEIWLPFGPTFLSKPLPSFDLSFLSFVSNSFYSMKLSELAFLAASFTSSKEAPELLYLMFSKMVPLKSVGS